MLSRTPKIATLPGTGLTFAVDVVEAADEAASFLEAVLPVAVAKTDVELRPLVVPSRETWRR